MVPLLSHGGLALGADSFNVTDPTTTWTVIRYTNNNPDPSNDQQTGSSEGDIVGNAAHPSAYTIFGNAGTPSTTDGKLGFRVRLGADVNPSGFKTAFFLGIDANRDGALDLFIGVNNSGQTNAVGIWNPGTGANISPSTTTIGSTPLASYAETAANYSWTPVTSVIDPTVGSATDIDGGGQTDYFLSLSVPFNDVVLQLAARGITGFDENSPLTYVMATSTQGNSLNQDLNGVPGTYNANATWATLGAMSNPISFSGNYVVPEPASVALFSLGLLAVGAPAIRRRFCSQRARKLR